MVANLWIDQFKQIVGPEHVSISNTDTELYAYDASLARGKPGMVIFPGNTREVAEVVRIARRAGIDWVPRGFGTNLSGGTVLSSAGLVVALSRFNQILEINPQGGYAVVQPGVTNLELQTALAEIGFFYAPDPASQRVATLGGNVGENSGGPRCLKYGVTTNHVLGLEVVLADGRAVGLGGPAPNTPGYDLRGALIGSEGTLAVVTEVTVRILPQPEKVITLLAVYDDIADAARSVTDITAAGIVPATLEMMDAPIIKAVEASYACGYPLDAVAVLIIEVEGPEVGLRAQADGITRLCRDNGCREIRRAKSHTERNRLWEGRRGAFGAVARLAPNYLVNDGTVPRTRLPEALAQVATIVKKHGFEHGNVFHAGDGNLHPLIFFDSRDAAQLERVEQAGWEIMRACVDLGGTISGEHGIGREKMAAMHMVFSEADLAVQRRLKQAFDPDARLNPGKILPAALDNGTRDPCPPDLPGHPPIDEETEAFLAEGIQSALATGKKLLPIGQGTLPDFGNLAATALERIEFPDTGKILEYDADNQVVSVSAAMPLADLQGVLAKAGQWLPLRPPLAGQTHSVGGVVALGGGGPESCYYGAPRDLLLGLRFLNGQARAINAGGRVVKNVAGYDMTRLLCGSAGTLGIITRATFRIKAIPERCAAFCADGTLDACDAVATQVRCAKIEPVWAMAVPRALSSPAATWRLWVGFEGFSETVDFQLERLQERVGTQPLSAVQAADYDLYEGIAGPLFRSLADRPFVARIHCRSDRLLQTLAALPTALAEQVGMLDLLNGCIWAGMPGLESTDWQAACRAAADHQGHAVLMKADSEFKRHHDVFGMAQPAWTIMQRIKAVLDPHYVFCPGRMPGRA